MSRIAEFRQEEKSFVREIDCIMNRSTVCLYMSIRTFVFGFFFFPFSAGKEPMRLK